MYLAQIAQTRQHIVRKLLAFSVKRVWPERLGVTEAQIATVKPNSIRKTFIFIRRRAWPERQGAALEKHGATKDRATEP